MKTARKARQLHGKLDSLGRVMSEVRHAVEVASGSLQGDLALNSGAPQLLQRIVDLEVRVAHLEGLAKNVLDDYERVRVETELQRETILRLLVEAPNGAPLDTLRLLEKETRRRVSTEWATRQKVESEPHA